MSNGQTGRPDYIAVHLWKLEAVRRTGIGALHVAVNTQESRDQNFLAVSWNWDHRDEEPGAGPISLRLNLDSPLLERKLACPGRSGQPDTGLSRGGRRGPLPSVVGTERFGRVVPRCASLGRGRAAVGANCYS